MGSSTETNTKITQTMRNKLLIIPLGLYIIGTICEGRSVGNSENFIRQYLGDDFSFLLSSTKNEKKNDASEKKKTNKLDNLNDASNSNKSNPIVALSPILDVHEHDHKEKSRHYHKNSHKHSHKSSGRHIHRHEHHHNHKHNHKHDHDGQHEQDHKHHFTADHKHQHQKKLVIRDGWKKHSNNEDEKIKKTFDKQGHFKYDDDQSTKFRGDGKTKDYHIKSVENYIGDSGKEFEGAAEQIVESYMGEYMQEYMQGWYAEYCENTGQFCDQVKLKHSTKDKSGADLVYQVESDAGYDPQATENDVQEDDISVHYSHQATTISTTSTTTMKTTTRSSVFLEENVKRKALVDKMRNMFHRLGQKYKTQKKKVKMSEKKKNEDKKIFTTTTSTAAPTTKKDEFSISTDEDFFDFVPMEYEVVEDVIIENF